jgi:hypothetical protein
LINKAIYLFLFNFFKFPASFNQTLIRWQDWSVLVWLIGALLRRWRIRRLFPPSRIICLCNVIFTLLFLKINLILFTFNNVFTHPNIFRVFIVFINPILSFILKIFLIFFLLFFWLCFIVNALLIILFRFSSRTATTK